MTVRTALVAVGLALVTGGPMLAHVARAQTPGKTYRVGYMGTFPPTASTMPIWNAFVQGLKEGGWVEGRNIVIERRYSEGKSDRLPEFAAEFARSNVDVIVAPGTPAARAARQATATIPIVTVLVGDPVGAGLVASLARPGGNVTGMSSQALDITAKQLELLRAMVPDAQRIAVMWNPQNRVHPLAMKEAEAAGRALGFTVQSVEVRNADDLGPAFTAMERERPPALFVLDDIVTAAHHRRITEFATRNRVPSMYLWRFYLEAGGLMAYGPNLPDLFRRAAMYVDRILKGARPGDLPVEQPTKFELIINRKAAATLGFAIPQSILLRAEEVMD